MPLLVARQRNGASRVLQCACGLRYRRARWLLQTGTTLANVGREGIFSQAEIDVKKFIHHRTTVMEFGS